MPDLYDELGVAADASEAEIKAAHRRKVKTTHPDAGGDRAAFDKVQRAYLVLSDAGRRGRYDRTGQVNDGPENSAEAQALGLVSQKLANIVNNPQIDPRRVDILVVVKREIKEEAAAALAEKDKTLRQITRSEEFKGRLRAKDDKPNRLAQVIDGQITGLKARVEALESALRAYEMAEALVEHYAYAVDPEPAPQSGTLNAQMVNDIYAQMRAAQGRNFFGASGT